MNNVVWQSGKEQFLPSDIARASRALSSKSAGPAARIAALTLALLFGGSVQIGCGGTCDRIEKDRMRFLERQRANADTHIEMTIPFTMANGLVALHTARVKPIDIALPGLGKLASYFGELSVVPTRVTIEAGGPDLLGFHLDFDVRRNGKRVFAMYLESEVRPEIDIKARKVIMGFTPEVLEKARPGLSKDAKGDLSEAIYSQIPGPARLLLPRSMVDSMVDSALKRLMDGFYGWTVDRMLPKMSEMSRIEIALPNVPLAAARAVPPVHLGDRPPRSSL